MNRKGKLAKVDTTASENEEEINKTSKKDKNKKRRSAGLVRRFIERISAPFVTIANLFQKKQPVQQKKESKNKNNRNKKVGSYQVTSETNTTTDVTTVESYKPISDSIPQPTPRSSIKRKTEQEQTKRAPSPPPKPKRTPELRVEVNVEQMNLDSSTRRKAPPPPIPLKAISTLTQTSSIPPTPTPRSPITKPETPTPKLRTVHSPTATNIPPLPSPRSPLPPLPPKLRPSIQRQFAGGRVVDVAFLFTGLDRAGISSTASSFINLNTNQRTIGRNDNFSITEMISDLKQKTIGSIKIFDIPGFCKSQHIEQDAELILALQSKLQQSLPNQIPTVAFIVTRFDDDRFEGDSSQFTKMLVALSHSQREWTDRSLSNVILVLTHSEKVSHFSSKDEISNRKIKFQQAFHKIFPTKPRVDIVLVDNLEKTEEAKQLLWNGVNESLAKRQNFEVVSQALSKLEMIDLPRLKMSQTTISELLPPTRRKICDLLDLLMQGQPFHVEEVLTDEEFVPYFVPYFSNNSIHNLNYPTKLLPSAKIVMGDGFTEVQVSDLLPGDKILNIEMLTSIVSGISRKSNELSENIGRKFVSLIGTEEENPIVLKYFNSNKKIKEVDFPKDEHSKTSQQVLHTDVQTFYEIKLDTLLDNGTFVANGWVLYV